MAPGPQIPNHQENLLQKRGRAPPEQEPCNLGLGNAGKSSASSQCLRKKAHKCSQGLSGAQEELASAAWSTEPSANLHSEASLLLRARAGQPSHEAGIKAPKVGGWAIQSKRQMANSIKAGQPAPLKAYQSMEL